MNTFPKIYRLVIALLAILVLTATMASAQTVGRTLTVDTVSATVSGSTVQVLVPVRISADAVGAAPVAGVAFTLTYDPAVLTFNELVQVTTDGWPLKDPEYYKVATPVTGYPYYNPYVKQEPYPAATYDLAAPSSLFFQVNATVPGKVLVSGASAEPLTGTVLFQARFTVAATAVNGMTYPINILRSIINNAAAGYTTDTFIPALVSPGAKTDGKYTTTLFPIVPATLVAGGITVTAPTFSLGGTAVYAAHDTTAAANAVGCTVTLLKETATEGVYAFNAQTTVAADGKFNFTGKPAGNYKVSVASLDPNFNNAESGVIALSANKSDVALSMAYKLIPPLYVSGTVTGTIPAGLQVKVVDPSGAVMGVYPVAAGGAWTSSLLPGLTSGSYKHYLVYGSWTSSENATSIAASTLALTLRSIYGTISISPVPAANVTVAMTASSVKGGITKTKPVTVTTTGTVNYEITDLPAVVATSTGSINVNDYIVSAAVTGFPLTYYKGKTDIGEATAVDISAADATLEAFAFTKAGNHITGAVTDGGTGVVGATVYAFNVDTFALISTLTVAAGAFDLAVPDGTYEVFAIKDNGKIFYYYTATESTQSEANATLRTVSGDATVSATNIILTENDKTISGKVTYRSATGDPAANVLITAATATTSAMALTGADGTYTITGLGPGSYTVKMKPLSGDYAVQEKPVTIATANVTGVNFIIDTGAVLSGTVTGTKEDSSTENVVGALLYLKDKATGSLVGGRVYFSGTGGAYSIRDIKVGEEYTLEVTHPDYQSRSYDLVIGADMTQNVALSKGAFFTGKVTDSGTGAGLSGATVIVTQPGGTAVYTVTNSVGNYSVFGLNASATNYIIIAQRKGYERQAVTGKQPATTTQVGNTIDFALSKPQTTYKVSGTVTLGSNPIAGAIVLVSQKDKNFFASATTTETGTYEIGNLIGSTTGITYNIVVIPPGLATLTSTFSVTTADVTGKNFTISTGNDISGTITAADIPATTKIYVFLYKGGVYQGFQVAGTGGTYHFQALADGAYNVLAVASGYKIRWYGGVSGGTITGATTITLPPSKADAHITLEK